MTPKLGVFLMSAVSALAAVAHGTSVATAEGNVYITRPDGLRTRITSSGKDYDPSLSLDEKYVVFARGVGGPLFREGPQPRGPKERSELWVVGSDGSNARPLFSGEVKYGNFRYVHFSAPHLSSDDRYVFFFVPLAATCDGLVRLDLRTTQVKVLTPAIGLTMLGGSSYRGYLLVQRRVEVPVSGEGQGGAIYPFWLYSPDGQPIREIGNDEAAKAFIQQIR